MRHIGSLYIYPTNLHLCMPVCAYHYDMTRPKVSDIVFTNVFFPGSSLPASRQRIQTGDVNHVSFKQLSNVSSYIVF